MSDLVEQTLQQWRATTFEHGQRDCLLSLGEYMTACGGNGYCEQFRGTYSTEAEAVALMEAHGGAGALGDRMGLPRTDSPGRGDAVIVDVGDYGVGGICTGTGVAFRRPAGVMEVDMRFIRITEAWRCGGN